jgi:glutamine synthetase
MSRWIRLSFVDVFGTPNSVLVPDERWDEAVARGVLFDGSALEGRARVFETDMLLRPVTSTAIEQHDGTAWAIGEVLTIDGVAWPGDPRTALSLVVARLGELASSWRASAELEFYLLTPAGLPVDQGFYFDDVDAAGLACVRGAGDVLMAEGIGVTSCHHEAGPGQYEIVLGAAPAVAIADALVVAKQAIRHAAAASGLRATFMPRPFESQPGSGLHLHQRAGSGLVDSSGGLDAAGRAFVGGLLAHASGLCALAAPTVNSYKRLHATDEAPNGAMWSHRHRAALVRVSQSGIEFRGADPSANPYLLVAGLLLAGADGLEEHLEPGPAEDESLGGFDARTSVRHRPLPRTLDEALDALAADDVLVDGFDGSVLSRMIEGRRAEAEAYRRHVTAWERDRYLDNA